MEPSGPVQACNGTAFLIYVYKEGLCSVYNVTVHHIAGANTIQSMQPVCILKWNYKITVLVKHWK